MESVFIQLSDDVHNLNFENWAVTGFVVQGHIYWD